MPSASFTGTLDRAPVNFTDSVIGSPITWHYLGSNAQAARAQVYDLSQQFLPKEWIMEKWEEGYYISAMAGSTASSSLVVMSKGTPYTQQSYKARARPRSLEP